jgi:hypothetical protein
MCKKYHKPERFIKASRYNHNNIHQMIGYQAYLPEQGDLSLREAFPITTDGT